RAARLGAHAAGLRFSQPERLQAVMGTGSPWHRPQPVRLSSRAQRAHHRDLRRARPHERGARLFRAAAVAPRSSATSESRGQGPGSMEFVGYPAERRDDEVVAAPLFSPVLGEGKMSKGRKRPMRKLRQIVAAIVAVALSGFAFAAPARAADPIKVGFSMALTGSVAQNGKQLIIALELWRDDVNAHGGLLGRPDDAEFSKTSADGARENAKAGGFKIIYDQSYPPSTSDFAPV